MEGNVLLAVFLALIVNLDLNSRLARALPVNITEEYVVTNIPDVVTEVVSSGDTGSGVTPDLREKISATNLLHPGGCLDNTGELHVTGSSWAIGCMETCNCISTPEGPIKHCSPPRCAIPMLSPGCDLIRNPRRNDTTGENCCDIVDCKPVHCIDSHGGKHEVYTSWIDGELDCFCQFDYQHDRVNPSCIPLETETTLLPPPAPREIRLPENDGWEKEVLFNETNETYTVCEDDQRNTYQVGETWRIGCQSECACLQLGEIASIECNPIPCPVPALLPGCTIVPHPDRDDLNSLNCCDKVVCPTHLCLGQDQLLYELNSVWNESGQECTCLLNYNVNQAYKKCSTAEEIQKRNQL